MKKISFLAALIMLQIMAMGQQTIQIEPFDKISISSTANIKLVPSQSYTITATANDISSIFTVNNNVLTVSSPLANVVEVGIKDLTELKVSGNGQVSSDVPIVINDLLINVSGKLTLNLKVTANKISVNTSGVSKGEISGTANEMEFNTSGISKLNAAELKVKKFDANISGSCKTTVDVTDELNTNVSGSATIYYKTKPAKMSANNSGIARVDDVANKSANDTTRISIGNININVSGENDDDDGSKNVDVKKGLHKDDHIEPHWGGLELGFNGYVPGIDALDRANDGPANYDFLQLNSGKSIAVNLNLIEIKAKLIKRYLWFNTGAGFMWNNYRFDNNNRVLIAKTDTVQALEISKDLSKNKLTVSYITIPAMFEICTNPLRKKAIHLGFGVVGAYKLGAHTKYKTSDGVNKTRDDFNINPFRLDGRVCIGFRNYNIFAQYGINELFKQNSGPALHPFTIGLSLVSW